MLKNLLMGLGVTFKHLFKKPVTLEYPEKKLTPPENFRGKPVVKGCVGCSTCTKVCPTGAITIEGDKFIIDLRKCMFCGNCAYYCPKGSIEMSGEYELASKDKNDLQLVYDIEGGNCERN